MPFKSSLFLSRILYSRYSLWGEPDKGRLSVDQSESFYSLHFQLFPVPILGASGKVREGIDMEEEHRIQLHA